MEKPWKMERNQRRRKSPSFSSSLLEAIYHSIDESRNTQTEETEKTEKKFVAYERNYYNGNGGDEEIISLRRAIMLEKWTENYARNNRSLGHFNSDSSSSTDSGFFSSSETEYPASRSTPGSSIFMSKKPISSRGNSKNSCATSYEMTNQKSEGRFTRTKSRALKMYGDLKKAKQPISPGGKIANFLNSIFNSRSNMKKHQEVIINDWRKSRSANESTATKMDNSSTSRSCLNKTPSSRGKSKRSVRFCPAVSVIVDADCHNNSYEGTTMPYLSTHYVQNNRFGDSEVKNSKKQSNFNRFGDSEVKNLKKQSNFRGIYDGNCSSDDDRSCTSSDLFELENVGSFGCVDANVRDDELPVYGTTSLKINQAIANGFIM